MGSACQSPIPLLPPSPRFPLLPLARPDSQRCPASRRPPLPEARLGPRSASASASCFDRAAACRPSFVGGRALPAPRPRAARAPPAATLRPRRSRPLPELRPRCQSSSRRRTLPRRPCSSAAAHRPPELVGRRMHEKREVTEMNGSELVRWIWPSELIPHIERIFARGDGSVHTSANQTKEGAAPSHSAPQPNTPLMSPQILYISGCLVRKKLSIVPVTSNLRTHA